MDVADDAEGRVAISSVEDSTPVAVPHTSSPSPHGALHAATTRIGVWMDGTYAGVAVAAALVMILVLGLLLTRH